jgi:hypothetical protein
MGDNANVSKDWHNTIIGVGTFSLFFEIYSLMKD